MLPPSQRMRRREPCQDGDEIGDACAAWGIAATRVPLVLGALQVVLVSSETIHGNFIQEIGGRAAHTLLTARRIFSSAPSANTRLGTRPDLYTPQPTEGAAHIEGRGRFFYLFSRASGAARWKPFGRHPSKSDP